LLKEAVQNNDADFGKMDEDADLDPIRDDPSFAEIMRVGRPDHRYAAVWSSDPSFEATSIYGLDPAAHLRKCRELDAQDYRPVSWSASQTGTERPLVTASVWRRPTVEEEDKDRLAERQARAAVALVRMAKADEIWPRLRHSYDPRLRSFIVNWLSPLGADPRTFARELDRNESNARPTPVEGRQKMDAILFHPETSIRRALILAMGRYGTEDLSPGEMELLTGKLLDLYRNHPDAGVHGAAGWTLRRFGQQERLKDLDAQLMQTNDWGERRWYVNSKGQTFAVIEGPVEFRMGSPPTEAERAPGGETPRGMVIPRRFAIAAREVTVEQFQRFLKLASITIDSYQQSSRSLIKYGPDLDGPWFGPTWYAAAHYCNWLSAQEGLPKDQWCYLPNGVGGYSEGMSVPADVLHRTGYRLPTEAEWEYACRAGAVTSRYYGHSIDLLDAYAWYQANCRERVWMCGSLLPNDLGLFDMLGNVLEWCHDSPDAYRFGRTLLYYDSITITEYIDSNVYRLLRGGGFIFQSASVRSALRYTQPARQGNLYYGFRAARTYH
jgi:eukaryotic-like serine/threonine-protein kinase